VKDLLVERAEHWPGVNGYVQLMTKRPLRARRPLHFFRAEGVMPEEVELDLVIPPELGPADEIRAAVRAGVENVEREMAEERRRTGKRVLGRRAVRKQSWRGSPTSREPRRNLRPRFAGARDHVVAAVVRFREFLAGYRDARMRWLGGRRRIVFPRGTYWLARFAAVNTYAEAA
jgi:putative transposase